MITILISDMNRSPLTRLIRTTKGRLPPITLLPYSKAFRDLSVPATSLIFTDFDLLSPFEMDVAGCIAATARRHTPELCVLNDPARAKERFALLDALNKHNISNVEVTRLEGGARPQRYPVFIRLEDGCLRPDTGLLQNESEYSEALASLQDAGKTLKRRIAVSFENSLDTDGLYRKYGAFRIGDHIVPQHVLRSKDWIVKSNRAPVGEEFAKEELAFTRDNSLRDQLMEIFKIANIEFGRADFTVVDGKIAVFEINTNPNFPKFRGGNPEREERRQGILASLAGAFEEIDAGPSPGKLNFCPDRSTIRYAKQRRWSWPMRQAWKLRMHRRQKQESSREN